MFVEALSRNKSQADNVFIAQEVSGKEDASLPTWRLVLAKSGYQTSAKHQKTPFFVTTDGYRYEGVPGQNDYKIIQFKRYAISMAENKSAVLHPEVETLSFLQLLMNGGANEAAAEWQWRISVALSALMLACLALPLSASAPRQMNRYLVLLPALLLYLLYINLLFVARHWLEAGVVSHVIGMWWAHGVMLIFVLCAMYFLKSWRNQ